MNIFNYLMNKKGHTIFHNDDILSYLLLKGQVSEATGTEINITNAKGFNSLEMTKLSTQDGTPSPTNPVEVNTVKGYRNLFDISESLSLSSGYYTYSNGIISIISATTSSFGYWINAIDVSNGDYTFMLNLIEGEARPLIQFLDSSDNVLSNITLSEWSYNSFYQGYWKDISTIGNNIFNITIPSGVAKIKIGLVPKETSTSFKEMLFSKGNISYYVPYGTNWIYTTISDGTNSKQVLIPLNNNEIAGIGDYKDELIVDKNGHCWLNKKIGKVVLDGSENWALNSSSGDSYRYWLNNANFYNVFTNIYHSSTTGDIYYKNNTLCNYFKGEIFDNTAIGTYSMYYASSAIWFLLNTNITALADFKTWLSSHNTDVYYQLATANLIDLNYNVDLTLYEGINNITNSEDMYMVLEYYK